MKRKITIDDHQDFRRSLQDMGGLISDSDLDDIDAELDIVGPAQHRKKSEVSRLLTLLDGIGKDGDH